MSALKLVERLDGVIQAGPDKWNARCPAHDDKTPSLSIRQDSDRALVYCHAGCATEDVLSAVGMSFTDLYDDATKAAYYASTAYKGRKFVQQLMRDVNPLEIELMVMEIAESDLLAGKALSLEDRARVRLAEIRLSAADRASTGRAA